MKNIDSTASYKRSSDTDCWETPQSFFENLNKVFDFKLDVCALPENAKCPTFYSEIDNGLLRTWKTETGSVWCNPPYRQNKLWLEKASVESRSGQTIVVLIPCRTDTRYFQAHAISASHILLVKGRLKFNEKKTKNHAPFPVMLLIFNGSNLTDIENLRNLGILLSVPQIRKQNEVI